jgi:Uma2 family endonuclease
MAAVADSRLITAEQYLALPDGRSTELVRGVVVEMNPPGFRHGKICSRIARLIGNFVDEHDLGSVLTNDSGIVTQRNPDTVRGADVAYYSYKRIPKGNDLVGYPQVAPELVVEVVSPTNTHREVLEKTSEYLNVGVSVVCVVDPDDRTVNLFYPDRPVATLRGNDELRLDMLPGFALAVEALFE